MASRRIAQSTVDWAKLQKFCPKHQIEAFKDFKTKNDAIVSKISNLPENLPPINWEKYQATVPFPAMLQEFKDQYSKLQVEYPVDEAKAADAVAQQEKEMMAKAEAHKVICNKMKASANKMVNSIDKLPPIEELTLEMASEYFPHTPVDAYNRGLKAESKDSSVIKTKAPKMHWDLN